MVNRKLSFSLIGAVALMGLVGCSTQVRYHDTWVYSGERHFISGREECLLRSLDGTGATVFPEGDNLRIMMPVEASFTARRMDINEQLMFVLDGVAKTMKHYPGTFAVVHGFADQSGSSQSNLALSERRAHAAIAYMVSQGVNRHRFVTIGHGEWGSHLGAQTGPVSSLNRCIEIVIYPKPVRRGVYDFDELATL